MAKGLRDDVGLVVLDPSGVSHNKLWSAFSGSSFRRKIIDTMRCGGMGDGGLGHRGTENSLVEKPKQQQNQKQRPECTSDTKKEAGSDTLSELLRRSEESEENGEEVRKKVEALEELKRVARMLQSEKDDVSNGAAEVRRLTKEDSNARATLALLGSIPPLVALLDSENVDAQIAALYALLNLGIGNDANKAAIVKAGAVHKMLKLIDSLNGCPDPALAEAIVANFLGLSALDSNKPIIGSLGAIPFVVKVLEDLDKTSSFVAKEDALRALYNLSISHLNVLPILETNLVPFLLSMLGDMDVSERILSILSNIISTPEGRKAISSAPDVFLILIDALNWTDSPRCQEKASYILMVMAHKAYRDRQAMIEAGIVSSLLELTLLGSTLAQNRASRILELLRVDKGKQGTESFGGGLCSNVSAPICRSSSSPAGSDHQLNECLEDADNTMSEERKAVKQLVQQSLQNNMKRIAKRANLPQDFVPSDHIKALTSSSTSKSLPF